MNAMDEASLRTELHRDAAYLVPDDSVIRPVRRLNSTQRARLRWRQPLLAATALVAVTAMSVLIAGGPAAVSPPSGEVDKGKLTVQASASAKSAYRYEDDGTHAMPIAIRNRATLLLNNWDAWVVENRSAGTPPAASYYNDPLQSAVITSISISSTGTLLLTFNGAGGTSSTMCGASYYPTLLASGSAVTVYLLKVSGPAPGMNAGCDAVGENRTVAMRLQEPLGSRTVLDVLTGNPVPVTP